MGYITVGVGVGVEVWLKIGVQVCRTSGSLGCVGDATLVGFSDGSELRDCFVGPTGRLQPIRVGVSQPNQVVGVHTGTGTLPDCSQCVAQNQDGAADLAEVASGPSLDDLLLHPFGVTRVCPRRLGKQPQGGLGAPSCPLAVGQDREIVRAAGQSAIGPELTRSLREFAGVIGRDPHGLPDAGQA